MKDSHDCSRCIKKTLQSILDAQEAVITQQCRTSCNQSINDLLGQTDKNKNTVPIILYGRDNKPFEATGVTTKTCHSSNKKQFLAIDTFVFKVKSLKDHCAILELLTFRNEATPTTVYCKTPSCQIDCEYVEDLISTGICINIDISCFCSVSCLPAVTL